MTYQPKPPVPVLQWGVRLTRGLIAAFACQSQGSNLIDIANRHDATPANSPTRSNSPVGRAISFDGSNQRYDSSDGAFGISGDLLTISAWINSGVQTKSKPTICAYRASDAATSPGWLLGFNTTGANLLFGVSDGTTNNNLQTAAPSTGVWHHVVGVKTATDIWLYVDGVLVATQASTVAIGTVSTTFRIGTRSDANTATYWNGSLADLRIWNRALTASQVNYLYREPWAMYRPKSLLLRRAGTVYSASGTAQGDAIATASGTVLHSATVNVQGQGSTDGTGKLIQSAIGSSQGEGAASAAGEVIHSSSGAVVGQGAASASGSVSHSSNVSATGQGSATAGGAVTHSASGVAQGDANATGTGSVVRPAHNRPLESSGQGLPRLYFEELSGFASKASTMSLEGFRFGSKNYWAVQPSQWEPSEAAWDCGDPVYLPPNRIPARDSGRGFGKWVGPGQVHVRPGNLWLQSLDENPVTSQRVGHDDLARVSMGATVKATWDWLDVGVGVALSGQVHLVLQDADTGAVVDEQTLEFKEKQALLPQLDANCILWARTEDVQRSWSLPPDYLQVRGFDAIPIKFKYEENGAQFVWDYEADVGRRPTDLSHPFYVLERQAFLDGKLNRRAEWTQYISDGGSYGGPWSALRIAVGAEDSEENFSVGVGFSPYPGPVLYEIEDEFDLETRNAVFIDPLALSVSASKVLKYGDNAGQCRIGGTVAGRSGPLTAYWHFHPQLPVFNLCATLLGASERTTALMCEASLYPVVSDVLEIAPTFPETRSTELVLTHAFLHQYEPDIGAIAARLPGLPRATLGHPGGRCLREDNGKIRYFTESFNQVGKRVSGDKFAQFYNRMREVDLRQQVRTGNGTDFHGDNCVDMAWNSLYGWAQDGPFGDAETKQYLAVMKSGVWDDSGLEAFPATSYLWQRVRSVNTVEGTRLLATGKHPNSEKPLWGVSDGQRFRESWLPFRPRRLTRVEDESGDEWIYAVGRFVTLAEDGLYDVADNWSLIRVSGTFVKVCAFWDSAAGAESGAAGAFTFDRAEALSLGLDAEKMPPFLWWVIDATQPAGGYWTRRDVAPPDEHYYLIVSYDAETVFCAPPSDKGLPYSPLIWDHFCFTVHDDGGVGTGPWPPEPHCTDAECVFIPLPEPPEEPPTDEICFFWNNTLRRFLVKRSEAIAAGIHLETFPPFLVWVENGDMESYPLGGAWQRTESAPLESIPDSMPYLVFVEDMGENVLAYDVPNNVTLPYEPLLWDHFCFQFGPDGNIPDSPETPVPHLPQPSTIYYLVEQKQIEGEQTGEAWTMIQVSDTSKVDAYHRLRQLRMIGQFIPNLWLRIDSDEPQDDMSTYTIRVPWNEPFSLPREARTKIEVVALYVGSIGATPTFETVRIN